MFFVALLSAIVSAPLSLIVQYIVTNILSLETLPLNSDGDSKSMLTNNSAERLRQRRTVGKIESTSLHESCGDSLFDDLKNLRGEVAHYQCGLRGEKLSQFTDAWGLLLDSQSQSEPHGRQTMDVLVSRSSKVLSRLSSQDSTNSAIQQNLVKELAVIREEVFTEYEWFTDVAERVYANKEACMEAKRMRLLYLFVKDLSSGVSGEVLSKKAQRDSLLRKGDRASWKWQAMGWAFVVLLNLGMLFYVYLFAMSQTQSRQSAWFWSFVMWFFFDVFVASTGVVLVTHLLIPLYVLSDVRTIKRKLLADITAFREKQSRSAGAVNSAQQATALAAGAGDGSAEFNAAKYLFTSWRVASLFPDLPESGLILQFSTPWPKKSFKREKKKVSRSYERRFSFLTQAVSRVLIFFVSRLVHLPVVVQDMLLHLGSTSGLGYVVLLMMDLSAVSPLLALVPVAGLAILVHFFISAQARDPSSLLEPSPPQQPQPPSQPPFTP